MGVSYGVVGTSSRKKTKVPMTYIGNDLETLGAILIAPKYI